jgi:hypothetical protein
MDFKEKLHELATKIPALCDHLETEEATKNALVMPFIAALGYDVFNPLEVIPEFTADYGTKRGEKVDYAIKKDDRIVMLFECKHCGGDLSIDHAGQLYRYFGVTDARIGVLTNGVTYRFFTDLEAPNVMDKKPFLEVNLLELNDFAATELKKLSKPSFNIDELMTSAGELKYTREIKRLLSLEMDNPSDEFVKFFASRVFSGPLTEKRRETFTGLATRAFAQFVNDKINQRLKSAISPEVSTDSEPQEVVKDKNDEAPQRERSIATTTSEIEGYYIVKSLLRNIVDPKRIVYRDTQSYCGILLDDNNRKPLARLYFNSESNKQIGIFDSERNEEKIHINALNDIFSLEDKLKSVLAFYVANKTK